MKPLLSTKDATTLLAIGSRKLWELTNCGEIPHVRIGRAIRYDADDLEEWIKLRKRRGVADERCKGSAATSTSPLQRGDEHRCDGGDEVG